MTGLSIQYGGSKYSYFKKKEYHPSFGDEPLSADSGLKEQRKICFKSNYTILAIVQSSYIS